MLKELFEPNVNRAGKPVHTNPLRWAAIGFFIGVMASVLRHPVEIASDLGYVIGGGFGGAFLFGVAAGIRNLFTR